MKQKGFFNPDASPLAKIVKKAGKGADNFLDKSGFTDWAVEKLDKSVTTTKEKKEDKRVRKVQGRALGEKGSFSVSILNEDKILFKGDPDYSLDILIREYGRHRRQDLKKEYDAKIRATRDKAERKHLKDEYKTRKKEFEEEFESQVSKQEQAQAIDKRIEGLEDKKVKQGGKPTTEQANELRDLKAAKGIIENSPDAMVFVNGETHSKGYGQRHIFRDRVERAAGATSVESDPGYNARKEARDKEIKDLQKQITDKKDGSGNELKEEDMDKLRGKIKALEGEDKSDSGIIGSGIQLENLKKVRKVIDVFVDKRTRQEMPTKERYYESIKLEWSNNEQQNLKKYYKKRFNDKYRKKVADLRIKKKKFYQESAFEKVSVTVIPEPRELTEKESKKDKNEIEHAKRVRWYNTRIEEYVKAEKIISLLLKRISETVQWGDTGQRKQKMEDDKQGLVTENKKGEEEIKNFEIEKSEVAKERQTLEDEKKGKKYEDIKNDISIQSREIDIAKREKEIDDKIASLKEQQEQRTVQIDTLNNSIKTAGDSYKRETENDGLSTFFEKNPNAGQDWFKIKQAQLLQSKIERSFKLDVKREYRKIILHYTLRRDLLDLSGRNGLDFGKSIVGPGVDFFKDPRNLINIRTMRGLLSLSGLIKWGWQAGTSFAELFGKTFILSPGRLFWNLGRSVRTGGTEKKLRHDIEKGIENLNKSIT